MWLFIVCLFSDNTTCYGNNSSTWSNSGTRSPKWAQQQTGTPSKQPQTSTSSVLLSEVLENGEQYASGCKFRSSCLLLLRQHYQLICFWVQFRGPVLIFKSLFGSRLGKMRNYLLPCEPTCPLRSAKGPCCAEAKLMGVGASPSLWN